MLPSVEAVSLAAVRLVAPAGRAARRGCARRRRGSRSPAPTRSSPATAQRGPPAFPTSRSPPSGRPSMPGTRRWSACPRRGYRPAVACDNCRNVARCPRCGGPLAQESSSRRAHLPLVRGGAHRSGLPGMRSPAVACGRRRQHPHRRGTRPGLSRGRRWSAPAAPRWSIASPPSRRWSSRRPEPNRSRTPATARCCCSTRGRCSDGPICGPVRRRCAAG